MPYIRAEMVRRLSVAAHKVDDQEFVKVSRSFTRASLS